MHHLSTNVHTLTIRSRHRKQAQIAHNTLKQLGHVIQHKDAVKPDPRNWDGKPQRSDEWLLENVKRRQAQ